MKKLFTILVLLITTIGYSQSGNGYVNYKAVKTHSGNGDTSAYGPHALSTADFDKMLDTSLPQNTLIGEGEVDADTSAGFAGGNPPGVSGDYYAVEFTGWFFAKASGQYTFYLYSDDSSEVLVDGQLVSYKYTGGATNNSGRITLEANTWYPFKMRWQEYTGGAYGQLQMYSSMFNGYYYPGHADYPVSNQAPVIPLVYNVNYNLNQNIDATTFSVNTHYKISEQETSQNSNSNSKSLGSNGSVDIGTQIDETLYSDGTKKFRAIPDEGGIAAVLGSNQYGTGNLRFYIDKRMFADGFDFGSITSVEILDIYSGPMEFQNTDPSSIWQFYKIEGLTLTRDIVSQSEYYLPNGYASTGIYEMNPQNNHPYPDFVVPNNWAVEDATSFKEQYVIFNSPTTQELETLVSEIITVSDIYTAFQQLSGGGLMGGFGDEYNYGIQYSNSDVNRDGQFTDDDTYMMLDWLNGGNSFDTSYLAAVMKLIKTEDYNSISSTNWNNHTTRTMYPLNLNTTDENYDINVSVSWLGDVNLSHSPTPTNNLSVTGKSFRPTLTKKTEGDIEIEFNTEIIGENLVVTLNLNPLNEQVVGTQFKINYDSSKLTYVTTEFTNNKLNNFHTNRGSFISLGSISTDGMVTLDSTTQYTLTFKTKEVKSGLGLVSIKPIDAVNKEGTQLKMVIK